MQRLSVLIDGHYGKTHCKKCLLQLVERDTSVAKSGSKTEHIDIIHNALKNVERSVERFSRLKKKQTGVFLFARKAV